MAYGQPPQYPPQPMPQQGPRPRPSSVTTVVWIQFVTAAVLVATAISLFSVQGAVRDAMDEEIRRDPELSGVDSEMIDGIITISFVVIAGIYIVFAVFYVVLGLLNNQGKRPARILSWILSGIGLLCCGLGGLIGQIGTAVYSVNDTEFNDEVTQAAEDATPLWVTTLEWISIFLFVVGSLLIVILLAVPSSNDFFRKEQPMPPYPGQPPYGQQPPGQQPPGQQPPDSEQPPSPGQ